MKCPNGTSWSNISHPFLLPSPGEHITGQASGHLPAERRGTKESGRTSPRAQTSDVPVAAFPLSASHPPPAAASLPRHRHRDFSSAVGQRLTPDTSVSRERTGSLEKVQKIRCFERDEV